MIPWLSDSGVFLVFLLFPSYLQSKGRSVLGELHLLGPCFYVMIGVIRNLYGKLFCLNDVKLKLFFVHLQDKMKIISKWKLRKI